MTRSDLTVRGVPSAMPSAIEVRGLSKQFGPVRAVDDLSFEVAPGRVTGFLGPNGSGKTTTLRMLLGLVSTSGGTATFGGRRYVDIDKPIHHVGAVLEATSFHPSRRAEDHLKMVAIGAGIPLSQGGRDAGAGRALRCRPAPGRQVLPGHAPAPPTGHRPARGPRDPHPRRAVQRARPPGHPVAAHLHPPPGIDRARGAGLLPSPVRDGGDRRRRGHHLPREAGAPDHAGRAGLPGGDQHRTAHPHAGAAPPDRRARGHPGGLPPDRPPTPWSSTGPPPSGSAPWPPSTRSSSTSWSTSGAASRRSSSA